MKTSLKIIIVVLAAVVVLGNNAYAKMNFWNSGLRDLYLELKTKKENEAQVAKMLERALALKNEEGEKEYSMKELIELGIVPTPTIVEELDKVGININSMMNCPPFSDITEPTYEWTQFDNKSGKITMTSSGLLIESKSKKQSLISVTEFPFNSENDSFEFGMTFSLTKAEKGKYIGIVFDYESNKDFKAIVFSQKDYIYYTVQRGEQSVIKQGLVKPGKLISNIFIKYDSDKLEVLLNGLEVTTINRISITSPQLGVIVSGKTSAICEAFYFYVPETGIATEQSTSDI